MNLKTLARCICLACSALFFWGPSTLHGQNPPDKTADHDVLLFTDGEKLIGQVQTANDQSLVFKSDMAGLLTIDWKKVKELHSARQFAVVKKGVKLVWRGKHPDVTEGELSATSTAVQMQPAPAAPSQTAPETIPVTNVQAIVDQADFDNAVNTRPNFFQDWKGNATFGVSLVEATQTSQSYTSTINLNRTLPLENWLEPANRTLLNFTSSYGSVSQPGTATVKTSIFHAAAERDQYFAPTLYVMADAGMDHDYSQGLNLQQTYGGGIGWTAIKLANEELDFKGELDYLDQQFQTASQNKKLLGSIFTEELIKKFKHNITFQEILTLNPALTDFRASSATGNVSLTIPVLKRIGVTMSSTDTFLNDPSIGYRKNSFQFTTGLTYTLP